MGVVLSVAVAGAVGYAGYALHRHERRDLIVGCTSATPELESKDGWNAVVDNYVYIHNAFRNDLRRIVASCEEGNFAKGELERWRDILKVHSRVEDEIVVPALLARLEGSPEELPQELAGGDDHEAVESLVEKALECDDDAERTKLLKSLETELDAHLKKEEANVMPLLLEKFSERELWALDSFIVNPKLGYCDQKTLMTITKWWFGNIRLSEGKPLLRNFIRAGKQPPMPLEEWKKLQDDIPALQKFPTEDLVS